MIRFSAVCAFFVFFLFLCSSVGAANRGSIFQKTYENYQVEPIQNISGADGSVFKLERAWIYTDPDFKGFKFERVQIRDSEGFIVAYTPTRMQAIPVCADLDHCWVFMWKTVYPLPAVFKFNPDSSSWVRDMKPVMRYSRFGYSGEGFEEKTDPVFGLYGLALYIFRNIWFFFILSCFTFVFSLQLMKFHDLNERKKDFIRLALSVFHFIIPPWFPLEPYVISAGIIALMDIIGTVYYGIASVISILVIVAVFFSTCLWVAKKRRILNDANSLTGFPS